jgi:hypothetical protein
LGHATIRSETSLDFATSLRLVSVGIAYAGAAHAFQATASASVAGNCALLGVSQDNGGVGSGFATAQALNFGSTTANYPGYSPGSWDGTANSSADLASGALHVFATSSGPDFPGGNFLPNFPVNVFGERHRDHRRRHSRLPVGRHDVRQRYLCLRDSDLYAQCDRWSGPWG